MKSIQPPSILQTYRKQRETCWRRRRTKKNKKTGSELFDDEKDTMEKERGEKMDKWTEFRKEKPAPSFAKVGGLEHTHVAREKIKTNRKKREEGTGVVLNRPC